MLKLGGTYSTLFAYCQRAEKKSWVNRESTSKLYSKSQMAEDSTLIEPAKENRDVFGDTHVPQSAVNVKRIQIVLKCLSHHL
jgi:hypothetical protein